MPVATRLTKFPDLSPKQAAQRVRKVLRGRGYGTFVGVDFLCFALGCDPRDVERALPFVGTDDFPVAVTGQQFMWTQPRRCSLRWTETA